LYGFVRNREKFPQITVIFALRGVVGSRGRNIAAALAKSPFAALKVLTERLQHTRAVICIVADNESTFFFMFHLLVYKQKKG
jgi:hypothetical protein